MKLHIESAILERFPGLHLGVVLAQGLGNTTASEELRNELQSEVRKVAEGYSLESLEADERFVSWREAFRSFGAKPKKYKCSVENLYRMIASGVELGSISPLVDIYNVISLRYGLPVGGDDIDKVDGDINLRFATGEEIFTQLNSGERSSPKAGEVIYADDTEVLCRRWNWRECDKSKMTDTTVNACLVLEGLPPFTRSQVSEITRELSGSIEKYCGGSTKTWVLSVENPTADF